jgi:hypothetical protein
MGIAVVIAAVNWSAAWAAAALVISCLHQVLNVLHRTQTATSFMSAMRENEYRRVMDDLAVLTTHSESTSAELRGLRSSLTSAGVISDQGEEIRRLRSLVALSRAEKGDQG